MNNKMTESEWKKLAQSLLFRKEQLEADLSEENLYSLEGIALSRQIQIQLDAITILLRQVPSKYRGATA
jgi:hypothetical protein